MSAAIQGIYVALFGRPADPGGLAYWTEVTKNGADLSAMLNVLPSLPEYTSRFEGMTNSEVVSTIYQSLFGRAPDAEGLAFFVGQLTSGAQSIATIAVHILNGAQGTDKADVDAKIDAAQQFTAALDTDEEIAAYNADAIDAARAFLDGVDKDNPATEDSVNGAVEGIVTPDEGQAPGGGGGGGGGGTLPEAVRAVNIAGEAEMLETITTYADVLFDTAARDLFDALPEGQGRQQAIAMGVQEQIELFGNFSSLAQLLETVKFHTETEHAKFVFINAIKAARASDSQTEMLTALELGKELSQDRQDLIAKWSDADAPEAANLRAAALEQDPYTTELLELANASDAQLQVLAHAVLNATGNFNGVGGTIAALASVNFDVVQHATGEFNIGGTDYSDILIGTESDGDVATIAQSSGASSIVLYSEGVEGIKNTHSGSTVGTPEINLAGAKNLQFVTTDFSAATTDPVSQRYIDGSTDTTFIVAGNKTSQATLSLKVLDLGEETVKLVLDGNAATSVVGVRVNSGATIEELELSVGEGDQGEFSQRNTIENIVVTGKGDLKYHGETFSGLRTFDASALEGNLNVFGFKNDVSATVTGGSGDDILNFVNGTAATVVTLNGGDGNDTITGGKGNDIINGGAGDDSLKGGAGADKFVFNGENFGNDTIHDYVVGTDILDLSAFDREDVAFEQVDANTVVTVDGVGTITLIGVNAVNLEASVYTAPLE